MDSEPSIVIYTDGGADPNPGPGGWGAVLVCGMRTKEISGGDPATTNNRMEITAAVQALRLLQRPCRVEIHTDSQYLRRGITEWVEAWQARGWRKRNGDPVENVDLWQELLAEVKKHRVEWHWVRGHRGNPLNERADRLATEALREVQASGRPKGPHPRPTARPEASGQPGVEDLPEVGLYARGCALGVPGPAGYAAALVRGGEGTVGQPQVVSGGWPSATSNVMELWAVIAGLRELRQPSRVTIHTSSKYVLDGATRWLSQWERRGWRTREGNPVKNREIWQELARMLGDHDVRWKHLPAAESSAPAEAAARAAREEAERQRG